MTLVEPKSLRTSILPPAESLTMTRLGTACPATKLRSEATGALVPSGQTTKSLAAVGPSTVTLSTTAFAVPGTPPLPATVTIMVCPWPSGELNPPVPIARVDDPGWAEHRERCAARRAVGEVAVDVDDQVGRADPVVE